MKTHTIYANLERKMGKSFIDNSGHNVKFIERITCDDPETYRHPSGHTFKGKPKVADIFKCQTCGFEWWGYEDTVCKGRMTSAKKDRVLQAAEHDKKCADDLWDRVYKDAEDGNVDVERIVLAMNQCNMADEMLLYLNHVSNAYREMKIYMMQIAMQQHKAM